MEKISTLEDRENQLILTACFQANHLRMGMIQEDGAVLIAQDYPCDTTSPMLFVDSLCDAIQRFLEQFGGRRAFRSIGVSTSGWVDPKEGVWRHTRKVDGFREPVPLAALLYRRMGLRAYIDNNVHLRTLAEIHYGVGRSYANLLYYHVGYGIGVGVAVESQLLRGTANYSGECGRGFYELYGEGEYAMLEDFASGRGMVDMARALLPKHPNSELVKTEKRGALTFHTILEGQRVGDELCETILQRALRGIGFSVVNLVSVTNSEALVFGGGILSDGHMLQWLIDFLNEYLSPPTLNTLSFIGTSRIPVQDVALIGASHMVRRAEGEC